MLRKLVNRIVPWALPILLIITWQLFSMLGLLSNRFLPAPSDISIAFVNLLSNGELFEHILISTQRAFLGLLIGGVIGLLFGILNGVSKLSEILFDSSLQMIRNIPHLSLIPLVILWFGIGEEGKIFLIALGVLFPIYLNTYHGIRSVDPELIEMGKSYQLNRIQLFFHVILPGALSSILVGLRFGLGIMWVTLIVAETISASSGIGFLAMDAREFMRLDVVVLSIILYALLGKLSDWMAKVLEYRFLRWNRNYQK
ncbi:ABC transporter permease subunit [Halalkalibacterium ligniniphilum]|uniref:ABC transporter permease subunit n=1 Tax=Halalkalibacterium ligniniphilum TaxID=1134413 RepID=UPI00034B7D3E|nr:ABC transporter permease subunit [Halalkalibacterium ligniniphilum]